MPNASWYGKILAQADASEVQLVEGNVYFPPGKVDRSFLKDSETHTVCPWKGTASYYDVVVDGQFEQFGPAAVGIGWDQAIVQGLTRHLDTGEQVDSSEAMA